VAEERPSIPFSAYVAEAWTYVYQSMTHSLMSKCPQTEAAGWGIGDGFGHSHDAHHQGLRSAVVSNRQPLSLLQSPALAGIPRDGLHLYGMARHFLRTAAGTEGDLQRDAVSGPAFPVLLVLTVLSGLAAHIFRYAGFALTCHFMYAVHIIIATPMLLVEMSFGKWSHMVYRPLALYFLAVKREPGSRRPQRRLFPMRLKDSQTHPVGAALVVGGGIGGMQAALDLANGGIKVYLAERGPAIGGVMAQLDKTFPTNDCAMCTMAPRLVEIGRHKDIDILTLSEVERVDGQPGNFTVSIKQQPRL
jgi:hypothetical protein